MDVHYHKIQTAETLVALSQIFNTVFEKNDTVDENGQNDVLTNPLTFALGAYRDETLVGGLIAYELRLMNGTREFYLYDIGVVPEFQGKGIGTGLVNALKDEARKREIGTIIVEAEADDDGAVQFYRSLHEEEVSVCHFNIRVK